MDGLIVRVPEIIKHEIKKQKGGFLEALLLSLPASLLQLVFSSVVIGRKGRRGQEEEQNVNFQFQSTLKTISRLLTISIMNLDLMTFFFKKEFTYNKRWRVCNKFRW